MTDFVVETKPANAQFTLAHWFVTKFLGRKWTQEDAKGRHFRHAQLLLKDYSAEQIKGCLNAMRDGRIKIGSFTLQYLIDVRNGEPPFMAQYRELAVHPPPQWMVTTYREWAREFDPHWVPPKPTEEIACPPHFPPPTSASSARLHTVRPRQL